VRLSAGTCVYKMLFHFAKITRKQPNKDKVLDSHIDLSFTKEIQATRKVN